MASFKMQGLFNETTVLGPSAPPMNGVSPSRMAATVGARITVTITGANTHFHSGVRCGAERDAGSEQRDSEFIDIDLSDANSERERGGGTTGAGGDNGQAESDAAAGDQGRNVSNLVS
jgi:hypothetical protein